MSHEYDSVSESDYDRMSQCQEAVILCPGQNSTGDRCTSVSPNLAQMPYFRVQCTYIFSACCLLVQQLVKLALFLAASIGRFSEVRMGFPCQKKSGHNDL